MECLPQDWAKTFSLPPPVCQQPLRVNGDLESSMLRFQPIMPKVCQQEAPMLNTAQSSMLKTLNAPNSIDPIVWIHEDGSVTRRSARIRALQQCQRSQQQQRLLPAPWGGETQVMSAPWQPSPCPNMALSGVAKPRIAVPEVVSFTRPWHRPGVYRRQNNSDIKSRSDREVEDECVAEEKEEYKGRPSIQLERLTGKTHESSEIHSVTENQKLAKMDTKNNVLSGDVQYMAGTLKKTKSDSKADRSSESLDRRPGDDVGHGTNVSSETSRPDPKIFATSLGLISVDVIEKPSVWLNVTLQVDTNGEIKRGQQGVQYRSLITNIVTELFYPPNLCPPDDLVADSLTATASYDDRGRLTVLQVEFITPGIYQVHKSDGDDKSTPCGKSFSKCVTLTRLESLETLGQNSQYLMIGDLCPVPRKIQKCHRNAQTLHKKLMEYLYTREFRKYTLPLLLEHGEEDVWSAALKAPRTRSRAAEHAEPSIPVFVKKRPSSPSPAENENRQNAELQPRRKRSRRCAESSSSSGDSVCSFPSLPSSPTCHQRAGSSSPEHPPADISRINQGAEIPSSHCCSSSVDTSKEFQRSSSPSSSSPPLFPLHANSSSSFPANICSTASSQSLNKTLSIDLSGNASHFSPIHPSSPSGSAIVPCENASLSDSTTLYQNSGKPSPSTSETSSPSTSETSSPSSSANSSPPTSDTLSPSTSNTSSPSNSGYSAMSDTESLYQNYGDSSPSNPENLPPSDSDSLYQKSDNSPLSNSGNLSPSDSLTPYLNSANSTVSDYLPHYGNSVTSSPSDCLRLYQNSCNSSPPDSQRLYQNTGNPSPPDSLRLSDSKNSPSFTSVKFNQDSGLSFSLNSASLFQDSGILSPTNDSVTLADTLFEPLDLPELCLGDELMFDFPLDLSKDRHLVPLDLSLSHSKRRTR